MASSTDARYALAAVLASYLITIVAYYLNLGDDFAIFQYFVMYGVCPGLFYWLTLHNTSIQTWKKIALTLGVFLATCAFGVMGIFCALTYDPPRWN